MKIDYALSNSFGFGGTNGALLFKRRLRGRSETLEPNDMKMPSASSRSRPASGSRA